MSESDSRFILGNEKNILALMLDEGADDGLYGGQLGPYQLIECLGEGGFGHVWRAEQTEPVQREVALKLLKRGMDSSQVLARFGLEQQALASMEHPYIAALLDAGITPDGRPFFVMELVRGSSITAWCRERMLSLEERVSLFKQVCSGVLHAHQKGMIHRDLKPSNILVTELDGMAIPKIIDFGIAKALTLSEKNASETLFTRQGHVMGTPLYMSPEQLSGSRDVDTRSDVYSLGVLFYEILTGSLPYQALVKETTSHAEMLRIVREKRPPRPSIQITETVKMTALRDNKLQQPPPHLVGIPEDLDWIILKALEQDRDRRYDSVAALISDLDHFLRSEPVAARPPSFHYLAGRWVSRHRAAFAAACISLTAIIGGAVLALWQAHEARQAQRQAELESTRARESAGFLTAMLDRVADEISNGRNPEALKLALENSQESILALSSDAGLQADLFDRVGWLYDKMGERKLALPLFKARVEVLQKQFGMDSTEAWAAELAYLIKVVDHGARQTGPALLESLLQRMKIRGAEGSTLWFSVRRQLIRAWTKLREPQRAVQVASITLKELSTTKVNVSAAAIITLKASCMDAFKEAKNYAQAEALGQECLQLCEEYKDLTSQRNWIEDRCVALFRAKKEYSRGAQMMAARVERTKKSSGAIHHSLIPLLLEQARFEMDARRTPEALTLTKEALAIARPHAVTSSEATPDNNSDTRRSDLVSALRLLAVLESSSGKHLEATRAAQEACQIAEDQGHQISIADAFITLAETHQHAGDLDAAYRAHERRHELTSKHGANYQRWHEDLESMIEIRLKQARPTEAMQIALQLWENENESEDARKDGGHMAGAARLGLRCHEALIKLDPQTPEPKAYAAWREAVR